MLRQPTALKMRIKTLIFGIYEVGHVNSFASQKALLIGLQGFLVALVPFHHNLHGYIVLLGPQTYSIQ